MEIIRQSIQKYRILEYQNSYTFEQMACSTLVYANVHSRSLLNARQHVEDDDNGWDHERAKHDPTA